METSISPFRSFVELKNAVGYFKYPTPQVYKPAKNFKLTEWIEQENLERKMGNEWRW